MRFDELIAQRTHPRPDPMLPAWTYLLGLVTLGVTQVIPLMIGGYLVVASVEPFAGRRLLAGLCILGSTVATFVVIYRDWRHGAPFNRSVGILVAIGLIAAGQLVLSSRIWWAG
jgi:hypothetical protein